MCGRFALSLTPAQFQRAFDCPPPDLQPSLFNIAPDSRIAVVRAGADGAPEAVLMRWGMLAPWMKEANDPGRQINARSETAAEKPMFRDSFRKGRCLIPASGFYEWQKMPSGPSRPFYVTLKSGEPFAFAGLWRRVRLSDGGLLDTCAILTTDAHPSIRPIHHRMPVILPRATQALWLDPAVQSPEMVHALLTPRPDEEHTAWPVSRAVNTPRNNGPELVEPVDEQESPPPAQGSLF
ncbi:MAG: SOS response-associated peptidase [Geminicoccaceae bacterium]